MWKKREKRRKSKREVRKVREEKRLDQNETNEKQRGPFPIYFLCDSMDIDVPIQQTTKSHRRISPLSVHGTNKKLLTMLIITSFIY